MGNIQMVGKSTAPMFRGEKPLQTSWHPTLSLDEVANHAVDFWLSTEDLARPENRVTLDPDGNITLAYTPTTTRNRRSSCTASSSRCSATWACTPTTCCPDGYLKNDIPIAGVLTRRAPWIRDRPGDLRPRRRLQGPRARQPVRRRHQLLPEHRRREPGAHGDGRTPCASATTCSNGLGLPPGSRPVGAGRPLVQPVDAEADGGSARSRGLRGGASREWRWSLPCCELDPHEPGVLRAVQHGLRRAVPATGARGHRAALLGAEPHRRFCIKHVFLAGLVGDLAAMSLLVVSQSFIGAGALPYAILLLATTSLGIGFGLTVPAINTFAAAFFPPRGPRGPVPERIARARHGAGAGARGGLPGPRPVVGPAALVAPLLARAHRLQPGPPLAGPPGDRAAGNARAGLPARFWLFAGFALLYGIVRRRTATGRRCTCPAISAPRRPWRARADAFWGMVTVGRVLFAAMSARSRRRAPTGCCRSWPPRRWPPGLLPTARRRGILAFGLAGLGCSALLPLTISFGQERAGAIAASRRAPDRALPDGLRTRGVRDRTARHAIARSRRCGRGCGPRVASRRSLADRRRPRRSMSQP